MAENRPRLKVAILAAGYGQRLQTSIERRLSVLESKGSMASEKEIAYLKGIVTLPKALIPINGKPLLNLLLEKVKAIPNLKVEQDVYLVTNDRYYNQFVSWTRQSGFPHKHLISDGTNSNDGRLGAIRDLKLLIEQFSLSDTLVLAADTLFDFSLKEMVEEFYQRSQISLVATYWEDPKLAPQRGIANIDREGRIIDFQEKSPYPPEKKFLAAPVIYLFNSRAIALVPRFLQETGKGDAPGEFLAWVYAKEPVYTYVIPGRWDIGDLKGLQKAEQALLKMSRS